MFKYLAILWDTTYFCLFESKKHSCLTTEYLISQISNPMVSHATLTAASIQPFQLDSFPSLLTYNPSLNYVTPPLKYIHLSSAIVTLVQTNTPCPDTISSQESFSKQQPCLVAFKTKLKGFFFHIFKISKSISHYLVTLLVLAHKIICSVAPACLSSHGPLCSSAISLPCPSNPQTCQVHSCFKDFELLLFSARSRSHGWLLFFGALGLGIPED